MKTKRIVATLFAAALGTFTLAPRADDIDLYTGGEAVTGAETNVLIFLDNSANWSNASGWATTQGEAELDALKTVIDSLTESINVGVMMHTESGSANTGYVRFAMRPMTAANKTRLKELFDDIKSTAPNAPQDKVSQSADGDLSIEEVFRYYNSLGLGQSTLHDRKEDYSGNADYYVNGGGVSAALEAKSHPATIGALGSYAYSSSAATTYSGPSSAALGCAKNYLIWIGNTSLSGGTNSARLTSAATAAGVTLTSAYTSQITTYHAGNTAPEGVMLDEWTRFMYKYGVKTTFDDPNNLGSKIINRIQTYAVDVFPTSAATPPTGCIGDTGGGAQQIGQHYLMQSIAAAGGGKCFPATNTTQLANALTAIFSEIQAVNSVFASATLPVSVNTQGTYENQVYVGVFRPDGSARPRWYGNLKEYRFGRYCDVDANGLVRVDLGRAVPITGTYTATDERIADDVTSATCPGGVDQLQLYLADQNGYPAIDQTNGTGFVDLSATSFWSTPSSYWGFMPDAKGSISDAPDGPAVERGGAAQRLRALWAGTPTAPHPDGRLIYTCPDTSATSCLGASATAANKVLSANPFTTTNSDVTSALAAPSGLVSVTLARSGNTVTATSAAAHGYVVNDSIVIAGATQTAYNGTKTVLTTPTTTTFTYAITETPATSVSAATLSATGTAVNVTSLTLSPTTPGATATVTVTPAVALAVSQNPFTATVANAAQSWLNGTFVGSTDGSGRFVYSVTLPSNPSATLSGTATVKCGTNAAETATGTWSSATGKFSFTNSPSGNFVGCKNFAGSVLVSGASDSRYNGTWTIATGDKGVGNFLAGTLAAATIASPDAGAGKTITPSSASTTVDLTRTVGSTTVTATSAAAHGLVATNPITISGSSDAAYNGSWTVLSAPTTTTLTFGPVTLGPTTPATGTITSALSSYAGGGPTTTNLINWTRGKDLWEDENFDASKTDVRASIHGDVLHSRPAIVNYGGSIGIVGFYGSNDGFLRAIHGGVNNADGEEKWAFLPKEFMNYTKLSRLYKNSELIRFPNSACTVTPTPTQRNYFWDGQITVYQSPTFVYYTTDPATTTASEPTAGCSTLATPTCYKRPDKTYLYASMRRGGRVIYALDVSVPDTPKLLWHVDNNTTGFSQLGYTWSEPKLTKIKGKAPGPDSIMGTGDDVDDVREVLVFGAGYDPTDDDQPSGCPRGDHTSALAGSFSTGGATITCPTAALGSYAGIGRGVFVVDAFTGAKVQLLTAPSTATKYSFPADVTFLDVDGDGTTDRIYAGDSGAQLFRFDVDSTKQLTASNAFRSYHLASFGDPDRMSNSTTYRNAARKFLFPPAVTAFAYHYANTTTQPAVMVLVGSGDREKPMPNRDGNNVTNVLTCPALYSGSPFANYYGARIRDKFYGYIDKVATGTDPATVTAAVDSDLFAVNPTTTSDLSLSAFNICYGFETNCATPATNPIYPGWYMNFKHLVDGESYRDEEKLVNAPRVINGILLFGTNTPKGVNPNPSSGPPVCTNLGEALGYAVDPFSGMPAFERTGNTSLNQSDYAATFAGGGLPPTVTAGVVGIAGSFYSFIIGAGLGDVAAAAAAGKDLSAGSGDATTDGSLDNVTSGGDQSSVGGGRINVKIKGPRSRVYWYYPVDDN